MRRGRRGHGTGCFLTMAALAFLLGGMGTGYASWTDRLESQMNLGTGVFHMAVSGKTEPEAYLLDAEGEPVEECGAVLTAGDGQNEAEFQITSGILAEMLAMGGSLRLEFPLECGADGTVQAGESSEQVSEVRLDPESVFLLSGGELFLLPEHLAEPFEKPLPCQVRTGAKEREGETWGTITLSLEDDGGNVLQSWPDTLTITEEEWNQLMPETLAGVELPEDLTVEDGEAIGTDTGVVVVYSLKCSLYLNQAGAVEPDVDLKLECDREKRNRLEQESEISVKESDGAKGGAET